MICISITEADTWNEKLTLTEDCIEQLKFWDSRLYSVKSKDIKYKP